MMKTLFRPPLSMRIFDELEDPIRSEIFSTPRLEMHAESLAHAQTTTDDKMQWRSLAPRVRENRQVLEMGYHQILHAVEEKRAITPAAEWMIDNFHIVRAQLKDIRDHLPPEYYAELPKLADGPHAGYPRVYGIAWAFVAHTDSRFDPELLKIFIAAYQRVQPLTIGELWAIPITLRLVLIENLRRLGTRIVGSQLERQEADLIADSLLGVGDTKPRTVEEVIESLKMRPLVRSFVVQLLQRLRFQETRVGSLLQFLDERLAAENQVIETWVSSEHTSQSTANVTTRNIITSSRLISAFDWTEFFEDISIVDRILREGSNFSEMDFATRDRYRHRIEELARYSSVSEIEIAQAITKDPGNALIGAGKLGFEKSIGFRPNLRTKLHRWYLRNGTTIYLGTIAALTALFAFCATSSSATAAGPLYVVIWILVTLISSEIAIAIVNRASVALVGPNYLPRLSFEKGISDEHRTFVVVPTMFTHASKIKAQLEQLEIHYLSNQDENVFLALLTDFADSTSEETPGDEQCIETAVRELQLLNERHPIATGSHPRFSIYHRHRVFSATEGFWMGWERKRGKLQEFNQLLLGSKNTTYRVLSGDELRVPFGIRYVITLDADTKMPRGCVRKLVGAMAHSLNHAKFDESTNRVVDGYGILQPRITPSLPERSENTLFRRLSASRSGIDPYASAVSDVYQDLFEEGSFTGKGIYDLQAFERSMRGRIPENTILSHDLLEGNFVRCGFLSDVEFFEDFPCHTGVAAQRSHRWMRGDWQLLAWIFGPKGNGISIIGRWKMIDNLRRSLIAPASFLLFVLADLTPGISAWPLILLFVLSLLAPTIISLITDLWPRPRHTPALQHFFSAYEEFRLGLARAFLSLVLLPQNAWTAMDAVVRANYRMFVSGKNLLEWTTAAQGKASALLGTRSFFLNMQGTLTLSVLGFFAILIFNREPSLALSILMFWMASPLIAKYFCLPPKGRVVRQINAEEELLLRWTARRIWRFFTTFVTPEDHFLPPDNFQEDPDPVVAHRSSPTNFGLYLLSIFAAKDFGWIGTSETIDRLETTLKSMLKLARHHGHFYNWYETTDRRPLEPRYISSVDNGNLTGHLYVVAQGCQEILNSPIDVTTFNKGVMDTAGLLEQEIIRFKTLHLNPGEVFAQVQQAFFDLNLRLQNPPGPSENQTAHWENLRNQGALLVKQTRIWAGEPAQPEMEEILAWTRALQMEIQSSARDFLSFLYWTEFAQEELPEGSSVQSLQWWERLRPILRARVPLIDIADHCSAVLADIQGFKKTEKAAKRQVPTFLNSLLEILEQVISHAHNFVKKTKTVQEISTQLIRDMDFKLLYDPRRKLFSIGMRVSENALDPSYYDLLASEARLTSFIAIAKGDVPVSHWFHLNRSLVNVGHGTALVSWSGSMFEYLMPSIVMRSPEGSLLDDTCRQVIQRQIEYGSEKKVPWGMSESAYNKRDLHLTYQYSNFGLQELGLKRGLGADLVVAPYASLLAALYEPAQAAENLLQLQKQGAMGPYGFYEAVDFTPSRLPVGDSSAIVKAYMAHHQGMALVSLANVFTNNSMHHRFHADPSIQATELLLQERTPLTIGTLPAPDQSIQIEKVKEEYEHVSRRYHAVNRPIPTTQLLSNGDYTVMLTTAGSGFSRVHDVAVTRWREDVTRDHYGYFFYVKDCESQDVWSAGYQPVCTEAQHYEVSFAEDRARIVREDHNILTEMEIFVSPEEDVEVRRLTITNNGFSARELEITSYSEVVLNSHNADVAHPAFSNLFVETEFLSEHAALLASRRPRSDKEKQRWMMHVMRADRYSAGSVQYETDRTRFLGRGRSVRNPVAIFDREKLTGTVGPVLDPVLSLRTRIKLPPGTSTHLIFSNGIAESKDAIKILAEKYSDPTIFKRASDLAWTQAQIKLHHLGIEPDEAHLFQRLATRLLYSDPSLRPASEVLRKNTKDVTGLWSLGISGDHPILLVGIDDIEDRGIIRQLLKAQIYFATKGFISDLVILNERGSSYSQELQLVLENMAKTAHVPSALPYVSGKVFVLRGELLSDADHILLVSEARAILSSRLGSLSDQVKRTLMQALPAEEAHIAPVSDHPSLTAPKLDYFNGFGGFAGRENEYVVVVKNCEMTPAPWINVIANAAFGFQVSESGAGYTWSANSRENQLTPWSNDPVCDTAGEAFYMRDLVSGALWSPTTSPIHLEKTVYSAHHGQGYSRFELFAGGIFSELKQFVMIDQPLKVSRLILENRSREKRSLSVTGYVEWVLGFSRAAMAPTTITEFDTESRAVFASNARNSEHGKKIAFSALIGQQSSFTCDRTEFIGRNSSLSHPSALLKNDPLRGSFGGGLDPCTAIQCLVDLKPGEKVEIVFILGQANDRAEAQKLIAQIRKANIADEAQRVEDLWNQLLGKIQVQTPDKSFDLVLNRWYLYQTIVCRLWSRAAFYQAGGAFGFRDQLQDVMAVTMTMPQAAREQILKAASRQFLEGDVQHWWHPPFGRGVRTHFSDDLLWLPYVVWHYLRVTQDVSILNEEITFLEGPLLTQEQEDSYYTPAVSQQKASIFEHCARALDRSMKIGSHGLPLMGGGDWNDGMNHVGLGGKGESVWLSWFLIANLKNFAPLAIARGESARGTAWQTHIQQLMDATEANAWDGAWYRRAFYDDGSALGTCLSEECQIDSLAQTWAIISGAGQKDRAQIAMQSVYDRLVKPSDEMILLFTPPFDKTKQNPGYIKGYLPGVRENGGQYTHAASWVVIATALQGDGKRAYELFSFLNPIHHSSNPAGANRYKIEPYVLAGDVYAEATNTGRGGWSWYTGAAGWMYRAGLEYILGLQVSGNELTLKPCVPPEWTEFKVHYRHGKSTYRIHVEIGVTPITETKQLSLVDDGKEHDVTVSFVGEKPATREPVVSP